MRSKKFIVSGLVAGFLFSLLAAPIFAGPGGLQAQDKQDKKEAKKAPVKVYIPKEVRDVMLAGLQTRQTRQDIPFTVFKSTFLPAQANYYIFLFLKMKNADLGYAGPTRGQGRRAARAVPPVPQDGERRSDPDRQGSLHPGEDGARRRGL
jgi:hypothetical protein